MKFPVWFFLSLVLSFVFSVSVEAQNEFSIINLNKTSNRFEDVNASIPRPRIHAEKSESKPNVLTALTVLDLERQAFQLINEKRQEQGLKPLEWNETVAKIARIHSQDMANNKFFGHTGHDGSSVDDRADSIGLNKWRAIGENIAYNRGFAQPVEFAVERWMQSPKHKQNLLDDRWQESAIGIAVTQEGTYYFTQVFLLRK